MDMQTFINGQMSKLREERLANSDQLLLGELKLKLESIQNKDKQIIFDFGPRPAGASSWRGSYRELGLEYSEKGGGSASWNSDVVTYESSYGNSYEQASHKLNEYPTAAEFLAMLVALTDKEMVGYKGGDFKMHKNVAVYLGNYGESGVSGYEGKDWPTVAPFDVVEQDEFIVILTKEVEY